MRTQKKTCLEVTEDERKALVELIEKLEPEDREILKIYAKIKTFERWTTNEGTVGNRR